MSAQIRRKKLMQLILTMLAMAGCTDSSDFKTSPGGTRTKKTSIPETVASPSTEGSQGEATSRKSPLAAPEVVVAAIADCKTKALTSAVMRLDFPEMKGQCKWDIGEQEGGSMMGHNEQLLKLPVESTWVLCSIAVSSNKENLYYDDYIALMFNKRVLLGTTGIVDLLEKDKFGLPIYDWSRLQRKLPNGPNTCLSGATKCALTGTQQAGALSLEMNTETNLKLMTHAFELGRYDFEIVATGDNDPAIDCAHTGIPLDVAIQYYVK